MEANNVEDYLQSARRRTRHLTSSSSSYCSLPPISTSTALPRPHPQASAVAEPLIEEVEEITPSPPPVVPREPCLHHQQDRERSSSASSGPSDHENPVRLERRPRTYDQVEDVPLVSGTATRQTVSNEEISVYMCPTIWRSSVRCKQ